MGRPPEPPPPPSKAPERQEARVLIVTSASVFTLAYLASAIGATTGFDSDTSVDAPRGALWIPAVGPFIAIGTSPHRPAGVTALYALDGVVQVASLSLFVTGLVLQHEGSTSAATAGTHAKLWTLTLAPEWTGGGPGAALVGTF